MIKLRFEDAKEVLDDTVVVTIALSGHTLPDALVLEHLLVDSHLILPALV